MVLFATTEYKPIHIHSSLPYPDDGSLLNDEFDSDDEDFEDTNEGEELINLRTKTYFN